MRDVWLVLVLLCVSMLLGCSQAPAYKTPAVALPAAYKEAADIWQPAQPSDTQPRGDWWKAYGDNTLNDLVARLDAANADLAAAAARFDQATAYAAQARASYFPTVTTAAAVTRNKQAQHRALRSPTQPIHYNDNTVGALADYELDLWGRVHDLVESGEAGAQAAAADLESIHLSLRAELANDYLALRVLDAQAQLLSDEVVSYTKALELTQNRYRGGIDSALDVSRAKVQLETAKAKLADTAAGRALFEHAIGTLVGAAASSFSIAPAVVEMHIPPIPVGLPSTLLERRPDVAAAERRLFAANASVGVAKAAFFPRFDLIATAGYESATQAGWLTAPNLFWSIGPAAVLTVFDAGRRAAVVDQAEAAYHVAGAQYRTTVLRAFQEVEDNLSLLNHLTEEGNSLSEAIGDTRRALDIAMNRYREGASSYLDVVVAQASAQQVQLDELNVRRRKLQASVNLIRALGGAVDSAKGGETGDAARKNAAGRQNG